MRNVLIAVAVVLAIGALIGSLVSCGSDTSDDEVSPEQATEPTPEPIDVDTSEPIREGAMMVEMRVGDTHTVALESKNLPQEPGVLEQSGC